MDEGNRMQRCGAELLPSASQSAIQLRAENKQMETNSTPELSAAIYEIILST